MKVKKRKKLSGFCIFPGYKWCGPGCSGPGAPINDVDACCKAHDDCLKVDSQCNCDREFLNCLRSKIDLTSKKGRIAALMYLYMRIQTIFTCLIRN
ncbi:phospholipase [Peribacillus sp. NJ4]|uniref:phospholipase n=1 Tax=Peribacillus TaxID=2675229 RepID=UPI0025A070B8|nr:MULTISPECIES: phospholipase [unclassified Peribacillus]MDM5215208.1 phospholipase [Peribacillus sp. NJ4]MDM5224470.1 phospholipase [Peribacillus sp. NJ11]